MEKWILRAKEQRVVADRGAHRDVAYPDSADGELIPTSIWPMLDHTIINAANTTQATHASCSFGAADAAWSMVAIQPQWVEQEKTFHLWLRGWCDLNGLTLLAHFPHNPSYRLHSHNNPGRPRDPGSGKLEAMDCSVLSAVQNALMSEHLLLSIVLLSLHTIKHSRATPPRLSDHVAAWF